MPDPKKNPYRELVAILRAIPEGERYLAGGTHARPTRIDGKGVFCGCAISAAYPPAKSFGSGTFDVLFQTLAPNPPEDAMAKPAWEARKRFYNWVASLGGDGEFLRDVIALNDSANVVDPEAEHDDDSWQENDAIGMRRRYNLVVAALTARADDFDKEHGT